MGTQPESEKPSNITIEELDGLRTRITIREYRFGWLFVSFIVPSFIILFVSIYFTILSVNESVYYIFPILSILYGISAVFFLIYILFVSTVYTITIDEKNMEINLGWYMLWKLHTRNKYIPFDDVRRIELYYRNTHRARIISTLLVLKRFTYDPVILPGMYLIEKAKQIELQNLLEKKILKA